MASNTMEVTRRSQHSPIEVLRKTGFLGVTLHKSSLQPISEYHSTIVIALDNYSEWAHGVYMCMSHNAKIQD